MDTTEYILSRWRIASGVADKNVFLLIVLSSDVNIFAKFIILHFMKWQDLYGEILS